MDWEVPGGSGPRASVTAARERLRPLLEARSVALVGASDRPGTVGYQLVRQLLAGGFAGTAQLVNPRYERVAGRPCHRALEEVPRPVDLAVLAVPNARLEEQLEAAARIGVRAVTIFASAHDAGHGGPPLTERLATIARGAGIALCGPNCMGFVNFDRGLRAVGFYEPLTRRPGPVTLVSHSGSVFSALLHNRRDLEFNLAVSTGLELTTTAADYLHYALELETTRVLALFLETVRDAAGFRAALARAAERDVPVVALKVGRVAEARAFVEAHSGALAGEDGAYEALFDAHGVSRVGSLDELADTVELFAAGRRAWPGGLATVHDSGGERAHLTDVAAERAVPLAEISDVTSQRLAAVLDPGLPPTNPLDAWGTGNDYEKGYLACIDALHDDPSVGAVALVVDLTSEDDAAASYLRLARTAATRTHKPFAAVANLRSAIDPEDARRLRRSGVPVLEGTHTALAAFGHLLAYRDHRAAGDPPPAPRPPAPVRRRWAERLTSGALLGEQDALALLADYGVPVVAHAAASSAAGARAAAIRLGWPVALKTAAPGVAHKSDVGGVVLGLDDERRLDEAYASLAARLGPDVLVARMVPRGVELAVGVVRDPQFGPLVVVGAGGVLVELLRDRAVALPPLDDTRARRLLDRLAVRPLLDGARGAPPADVTAVTGVVAVLGALAEDLGEHLDALDVNPLVAGPDGCVVVDARAFPRGQCR